MAKRPRDADADADADAHSAHSAVRMCRVLPRPLPPRPVEQIVAAESAKAGRGASVCATVDDKDSNQWDIVGCMLHCSASVGAILRNDRQ